MAFSRKETKETLTQLVEEKISVEQAVTEISERHTEIVKAIQADRDEYKQQLAELEKVQADNENLTKEVEKLKKTAEEYEKYKTDITTKEEKAAKENAVRDYLTKNNIDGNNLEIAIKAMATEIGNAKVENGKIKDTSEIDGLISGTLKGLVSKVSETGIGVAKPPSNNGGKITMTKAEIMAIKDGTERRQKIAENPELFGLTKE